MPESVYIETTIVSYLTARPSSHPVRNSHQLLTKQWWTMARSRFRCVTSGIVVVEASAGDPSAAAERLSALKEIELLDIPAAVEDLAARIAASTSLPTHKAPDALHVAIAAIHRIDVLLTWNCTHLANVFLLPKIERTCIESGYRSPRILTPEFLLEAP